MAWIFGTFEDNGDLIAKRASGIIENLDESTKRAFKTAFGQDVNEEKNNMSKRVITFGQWDGKPIQWLVLKEDGFKELVVSQYPLFAHRFNEKTSDGNRWKTSSLRNYLNSTFWETAFSAEEKKKVVNCMLEHPDHTKDNVFVLSKEEAKNLLTKKERVFGNGRCYSRDTVSRMHFGLVCHTNCSNCFIKGYKNGYGTCCWLRSPDSVDSNKTGLIKYTGKIDDHPINKSETTLNISTLSVNNEGSVRPALYLKK